MKVMARMRRRLLEDFIVPALNSNKYPGKLYWLNKEKGVFRLYWSHKNAAKWQSEDTIVFQDWDRLKGHFKPEGKNYFMSAKQRFRAALYKLSNHVTPLKSAEKTYRDYQLKINENECKRQSENLLRSKVKGAKKANQCNIRPSVICKNTSYIAKSPSGVQKKERKSPSPIVSCDDEQMIIEQYSSSMEKINQLKMSRQYENLIPQIAQKYTREGHETSVLRENSSTPRASHIASQPIPVYCAFKHNLQRQHTIHVGPEIFVSKIYNGPENVPQTKDGTQSSMYATNVDMYPTDGILNLSLKSDVSDPPSR